MIRDLITDLSERSIQVRLANTTRQVKDLLRKAGLEEKCGRFESTDTISTNLDECHPGHNKSQ